MDRTHSSARALKTGLAPPSEPTVGSPFKVPTVRTFTLTDYEVADAAVAAVVGDFYNKQGKLNVYISAQKHPCADAIAAVQASLDKVSYFAPAVELVRAFASEFSI